ncbi:cytochrome c oxidase assembly protein subunit 11 [Roseibium hamelinense]|uniref:Cytochrome c oxidase assembly protein CtaG n=1 Tax=Roseibium hamelinense TaxID=150831 RepID=A0A562T2S5_9HYPH|nr:cytochrome c oxidase assembly protein [Roseibium hamelinense]MTI42946.1 cytochrome c oxidase assembly protein [Roseibium hamelinense]TWI87618.1 cytochrome c oxidase assembly protein subunit 11 [Roseibium hamelinense]
MTEPKTTDTNGKSNLKVALACTGMFTFMIGAAYAAVPLYDLFCRVTGFGGTTQVAEYESDRVIDRKITIRFDGNVNGKLPWSFKPEQRTVTLKMGETGQLSYVAMNTGDMPTVGTSTFNVTPLEAGSYFNKIQCFCFTEQALEPGENIDMPVVFFVDPDMNDDPDLAHVKEITLSYTFFPVETPTQPVAARVDASVETKL